MDSDPLNKLPATDTDLEARLRALAPASLPDDGFSDRVLAALPPPPPRARSPLSTAWTFAAIGAVAGVACFHFGGGSWSALRAGFVSMRDSAGSSLGLFASPEVGLALGVTLFSLAFVYWREVRHLLPRFN